MCHVRTESLSCKATVPREPGFSEFRLVSFELLTMTTRQKLLFSTKKHNNLLPEYYTNTSFLSEQRKEKKEERGEMEGKFE